MTQRQTNVSPDAGKSTEVRGASARPRPAGGPASIDDVIVQPPEIGETINPRDLFPDARTVELEIGCGKGGFLVRRALSCPDVGLLGVEWANQYFKFAADRMVRRGIANVRVMRTDAALLVKRQLVERCLDAVHIYHPDPWPKKRHHKRRIIQVDFLKALQRALVPGGRLAIQTDHEPYFEHITECLAGTDGYRQVPFEDERWGVEDGRTGTNYETKYLRSRREIFQIAVVRQA